MSDIVLYGLGASLELNVTGEGAETMVHDLRRLWARCIKPAPVEVEAVPLSVTATSTPAEQLTSLTQHITRRLLEAQVGRVLLLHAGAVCHPVTGASIIYVAPGGTGKTTLSARLATRMGYLTDETVALTSDGRILRYPKPLSVCVDGSGKMEISPDDAGLMMHHPSPVAASMVLLDRGDHDTALQELDLIDALIGIGPEASSLNRLPRPLHRLADAHAAFGPIRRARYRESSELADLIFAEFGC